MAEFGSGRFFHASKMHAIDSSHKITLYNVEQYDVFVLETDDELAQNLYCLKNRNNFYQNKNLTENVDTSKLPKEIDWRKQNYVTNVKNQYGCGSCWAHSAIGALEALHKKKKGILESLSVQNLLDCLKSYGNNGCNGGYFDQAFAYVRHFGIESEQTYPSSFPPEATLNFAPKTHWVMSDPRSVKHAGPCLYNSSLISEQLSTFIMLPMGDENLLMQAVANNGPVSAAIFVSFNFIFYKSGVFFDPKCKNNTQMHAILVIGYGTDSIMGDYWILKNSWGDSWGEDGYAKLARNRGSHCGIALAPSYPI